MNKTFAMIMPYIMLVFARIMNYVESDYQTVISTFVLGFLIGIWYYCVHKSEGTVMMKLGMVFNIVLFIVAAILGIANLHLDILSQLSPMFALLIGMECIGLYIVSQNKPRLNMTYKYSYKTKRRRYF